MELKINSYISSSKWIDMQKRAITGNDFEKSINSRIWIRQERKPKMVWNVPGSNVFDKMKNVNYDVYRFNLRGDSILCKYDFVYHKDDTLTFEAKRYEMKQLNKWTLYSEPFFKVSTHADREKIEVDVYNKFVNEFYENRKDIIDEVLNGITNSNLGVKCIDGFIPQHRLEYKVEVIKGWGGYNRISILFKANNDTTD